MATRTINAIRTPQVVGNLTSDGEIVNFYSFPSGSTLVRWISQADIVADNGKALQDSLGNAVEQILGEGLAIFATGVQTIDDSGFLADQVDFTVKYVPSYPIPGEITGVARVPVPTLVADTQFGNFLGGGNAAELILEEYNRLKSLAGD